MKPHYQILPSLSHTSLPISSKETIQICPKVSPKLGSGALGISPLENYPKAKEPPSAIDQSLQTSHSTNKVGHSPKSRH